VVRGAAALLAGTAYLLLAGELPGGTPQEVQGALGVVAIALCALGPLAGRDEPAGLAVFGVGAVLLAIALNGQGVVADATPVEALFGAAAGLLFAYGFGVGAAVVALPVVVAGIDAASLLGGGADAVDARAGADLLTLALPAWGSATSVSLPALGLLDTTFLALFAAWSVRFDLRPRVAVPLMVVLLVAAVLLSLALDRAVPTLPFLALGLLAPAARRLPALVRSEG
jgi:hypothetical protein